MSNFLTPGVVSPSADDPFDKALVRASGNGVVLAENGDYGGEAMVLFIVCNNTDTKFTTVCRNNDHTNPHMGKAQNGSTGTAIHNGFGTVTIYKNKVLQTPVTLRDYYQQVWPIDGLTKVVRLECTSWSFTTGTWWTGGYGNFSWGGTFKDDVLLFRKADLTDTEIEYIEDTLMADYGVS